MPERIKLLKEAENFTLQPEMEFFNTIGQLRSFPGFRWTSELQCDFNRSRQHID